MCLRMCTCECIHTYTYMNIKYKVICGTLKRCLAHTHKLMLTLTHIYSHPHTIIIRNAHKNHRTIQTAVDADDDDDDAGH